MSKNIDITHFGSIANLAKTSTHKVHHIAGWGWNSESRAGNLTETVLPIPRQVQRSKDLSVIDVSAGMHHSLLVTNEGIVYSFGDGRKSQLGYGNPFNTDDPTPTFGKTGMMQAIPSPITPTGLLKLGRDVQCIQVAAGGTFSVAREPSPEEAAKVVNGFLELEKKLQEYLVLYPESDALRRVWGIVRQERCSINRRAQGFVLTWGTGQFGELGQGDKIKEVNYPLVSQVYYHVSMRYITFHCDRLTSHYVTSVSLK